MFYARISDFDRGTILEMIERIKTSGRCARKDLLFKNKMVSIEPIMDFDLEPFVQWISDIKPILVHVGYDDYSNNLVEQPLSKTKQLIDNLRKFTTVKILTLREKVG